jgi:hypothetical protein
VTDGKTYSFGGLGRRDMLRTITMPSFMPRAFETLYGIPMGLSFGGLTPVDPVPLQHVYPYLHQGAELQNLASQQSQAQHGQMAIGLAGIRNLLLPGLQAVAGVYQAIPMQWANAFSTPRIDGETAARSRERSRGLLKSLLTDAQWAEFENAGRVTERLGGCEFILTPGGMIEARKRRIRERWCVNPDPYADGNDFMPHEDLLIGQLLHLRAGPDKLRAQANVFQA